MYALFCILLFERKRGSDMKKIIILFVMILIAIPIYASSHFHYNFKRDITLICPDCDYWVSCETDSMYPVFNCNDTLITIEPRNKKDIKVGSIILFRGTKKQLELYEGDVKYIIHRVKEIDHKRCYITKGDNNYYEDDYRPCFYDVEFIVKGVIYE